MPALLDPPPPGDGHPDVHGTLDTIPALLWVAGPDGQATYFNRSLREYLGRPLAELTGTGWQDLVHPDERPAVRERTAAAVRTGGVYEFEHRMRRADGAFRWLRVRAEPVRDAAGRVVRWVGTCTDVDDRRRAEAAVARDSLVLAGVSDSVIMTDLAGVVTYWNEGATRLFGWTAAEMVGRPITDRYPEHARPELAARVRTRAAGAAWDGEIEDYHKDGSRVWIDARARRLDGPDGTPVGLLGVAHDVTARKTAEAALRAGEARFRAVVEDAFDAVYLVAADGTIRYASPAAETLLGYAPGERVGNTLDALVHRADVAAVRARFGEVLAAPGARSTSVHRARHKALGYRRMEARGTNLLADPAVGAVVVHVRDVTEAWDARAAADRTLARLEAVVSGMAEGLITADGAGNLIDWNPAALRLHGFDTVDEVRRPLSDFTKLFALSDAGGPVPYDDWPMMRLLRGEAVENLDLRLRRLDVGREWDVTYNGRTVPGPDGRPELIVLTLRDVTARKRLEEGYRRAEKMQAVGRLAGGFAHEMNNLLTVVNGYSEVLLAGLPPADDRRPLVEEVRTAGERAAGLTRQLLALSHKQMVTYRVLDLPALLTELGGRLRPALGPAVRLEVSAPGGVWPVKADPGQVEQVVANLAANARDAMPGGGPLTLSARNVTVADGAGVPAGRYVELAVADAGVGIPPEVEALIFEPFFTTKGVGEGTGLGLAVVHGIVQAHGGHVRVETAVGAGSTFRVRLPAEPEPPPPSTAAGRPPTGTETILVVEDEVRRLAARALGRLGYTVLEAADGEAGLAAAAHAAHAARPIDLLVTDVTMPRLGGRELAERLQARDPRLRVLFLSGYTDDAVVRHGIAAARVPFLQKPFTPDGLARKVRTVLDGAG